MPEEPDQAPADPAADPDTDSHVDPHASPHADPDADRDADPDPRAAAGRFGASIRNAGYLPKWLVLGITIGVIAGLGAVVFYLALKYTGEFLLGYLAGYHVPTPLGEGGNPGSTGFVRPWAIPLVTTGGALLSALIVAKLAPEATGHGTDEAIEAVHTDPRAIRGRAVLVKMVASALTIGSGGSGGREGPTAHISAGFCSLLTRRLNLSDEDGRIAHTRYWDRSWASNRSSATSTPSTASNVHGHCCGSW
jgi:CIC family chloride channel protein